MTKKLIVGTSQLVADLNSSKIVVHDNPIVVRGESEGIQIDIAMQWNDSYDEAIYCFTNDIENQDGGAHLAGFRAALTRTVNAYAQVAFGLKDLRVEIGSDDIGEGLTAIVSITYYSPNVNDRSNDELVSSAVERIVTEKLGRFLEQHPSEAREIVDKVALAARARAASRKVREMVLRRRN
jgi:DNA gyrase subunit B